MKQDFGMGGWKGQSKKTATILLLDKRKKIRINIITLIFSM